MSHHRFASTGVLALCLMIAGMAPIAKAEPSSAKPQASHAIVLAEDSRPEPGVPRGAKCASWVPSGHGKWRCNSFCYPRYEKC